MGPLPQPFLQKSRYSQMSEPVFFLVGLARQPTEACTALKEENSAFHGTTNLIYSPAANERAAELSGEYFTDGKTKGEVYVQYVGEKLLKRFEK